MDWDWFDYQETTFGCETCSDRLYRVRPSNLLTCINPGCDNDEPMFLVETS
jgi:hypothetical protein